MILLDTHVLLWLVSGSVNLGSGFQTQLQHSWEQGEVAVSSFTFWEISLLHAKGRLELVLHPRTLRQRLVADGLRSLPVDDEVALLAVELGVEGLHPDPTDRIIAATAILGGFRLATADHQISAWAKVSRMVSVMDPTQ